MHEELARKGRKAKIKREIGEASSSQGTCSEIFHQSSVSRKTQDVWTTNTETAENSHESNIAKSVNSTPEIAMKLVPEGKFSASRRDSKAPKEIVGRDDRKDRIKTDNGACRQGATSQQEVNVANKVTSELLIAECIQNWSETIIVEKCRQEFKKPPRGCQTSFERRDSLGHE